MPPHNLSAAVMYLAGIQIFLRAPTKFGLPRQSRRIKCSGFARANLAGPATRGRTKYYMGRRQNRGLAKVRCLRHDNIQMSTVQMMMTSISALIAVIVLILISFTLTVPTYNTQK